MKSSKKVNLYFYFINIYTEYKINSKICNFINSNSSIDAIVVVIIIY